MKDINFWVLCGVRTSTYLRMIAGMNGGIFTREIIFFFLQRERFTPFLDKILNFPRSSLSDPEGLKL